MSRVLVASLFALGSGWFSYLSIRDFPERYRELEGVGGASEVLRQFVLIGGAILVFVVSSCATVWAAVDLLLV